jgi:hypothetical protein
MKDILNFLKKDWYLLIVIPLAIALLLKVLKVIKVKPKDSSAVAEKVLNTAGVSASKRGNLIKIASGLAHHLGTAYAFYDPRHWSENDKQAYELLIGISQTDFNSVSLLYFEVYAKGNTLSTDLRKLLDSKYYELLKIK